MVAVAAEADNENCSKSCNSSTAARAMVARRFRNNESHSISRPRRNQIAAEGGTCPVCHGRMLEALRNGFGLKTAMNTGKGKLSLAEIESHPQLSQFPNDYYYFASQWGSRDPATMIIVLEKHH